MLRLRNTYGLVEFCLNYGVFGICQNKWFKQLCIKDCVGGTQVERIGIKWLLKEIKIYKTHF